MANIVITSTTNTISVQFNDYSTMLGMQEGTWAKHAITAIIWVNGYISIFIDDEKEWQVSFDGSGTSLQIDTIDTVTPTSNSDLYNKLKVLIQ